MIGTLLLFGGRRDLDQLAIALAWGSVVGSLLQFGVQARQAWALTRHDLRARHDGAGPSGRAQLHAGAGQPRRGPADRLHRYDDRQPAPDGGSHRPHERADPLYAAGQPVRHCRSPRPSCRRCPATQRATGRPAAASTPCPAGSTRPCSGWPSSSFRPRSPSRSSATSSPAYCSQTGRFTAARLALRLGHPRRLVHRPARNHHGAPVSAAHYAVGDTKSPLRFALLRLVIVTTLGYACAILLPPRLGIAAHWGAAGLTSSGGCGRVDRVHAPARQLEPAYRPDRAAAAARRAAVALGGGGGGRSVPGPLDPAPVWPAGDGAIVLPLYGCLYLALAALTGVPLPGFGGGAERGGDAVKRPGTCRGSGKGDWRCVVSKPSSRPWCKSRVASVDSGHMGDISFGPPSAAPTVPRPNAYSALRVRTKSCPSAGTVWRTPHRRAD